MSTFNKVQIQGRLGSDPEVRYDGKGMAIANLSVATNSVRKNKETGERIDDTEWHRVVLFDKRAETAGQILKKGSLVYFEGSIKTRKWTDKEGRDQYTTEIRANEFILVQSPREAGDAAPAPSARPAAAAAPAKAAANKPAASGYQDDQDDSIPF